MILTQNRDSEYQIIYPQNPTPSEKYAVSELKKYLFKITGAAIPEYQDNRHEEAKEIILRYQREAAGLNSLRIVGHGQLSETLTVTEFEDGTRVYVNYGTEDSTGEVSVPARDYLVVREEGK